MGQYFRFVNEDKKEFIDPFEMNVGWKLWEIAANNGGNILTLLLRRSEDESSAGEVGAIYENEKSAIAGRWAGDRISLVGDYDSSDLFACEQMGYKNITREAVAQWNKFAPEELRFNWKCRGCECSRKCICKCHN